ncbi:MAG: gliding motility lipoprotein GldH [Paludibacteraceae bacterium]|jgi:gliding motility-associated lipoprotein GldH|nr:gliding motility lipoprotein GldH [Paludibacteraceae bacterium]
MKPFTMNSLRLAIGLLIGCVCLLTSCRHDIVYSEFVAIPSGEWDENQLPEFAFNIADREAAYDILLYVRHTERYPYQNMWLFVRGNRQYMDTVEFYLADDRGRWLGDKHHGFIEMPVLLEENYHFPDTGRYYFAVQHGMRDSLLRGVTDVGIEVIRVKNER